MEPLAVEDSSKDMVLPNLEENILIVIVEEFINEMDAILMVLKLGILLKYFMENVVGNLNSKIVMFDSSVV
jgi:hypothetical protein